MVSGAQAYSRVARATPRPPREVEAELLIKAAAQLHEAQNNWEPAGARLEEALAFNRRLWTILVASATEAENPLPPEVKQNVANLGIFVLNRSLQLMAEPAPEKLDALITINLELAGGLRSEAAAA